MWYSVVSFAEVSIAVWGLSYVDFSSPSSMLN